MMIGLVALKEAFFLSEKQDCFDASVFKP